MPRIDLHKERMSSCFLVLIYMNEIRLDNLTVRANLLLMSCCFKALIKVYERRPFLTFVRSRAYNEG